MHLTRSASDKVYQLLAHGRWFSPGTPVSSTTKTGRHDIAEILLKVALNTINQNLFEQVNYIDWIKFCHSPKYGFFWYPLPLLTENIIWGNQDININVIDSMD